MKLKIGDRVKVPHGVGEVRGFERLTLEGDIAPLSDVQLESESERVAIRLDTDPAKWPAGMEYYAGVRDIVKL